MAMTIDIEKMRARLKARQAELQEAISGLPEAPPTPVDPITANEDPHDSEDMATDITEMVQEQSIQVNEQALLTEIERALARIDAGTYGLCVQCGQPIPEKRLEALPWAARDVQCESQLEQRNLGREELYPEETQ